MPVGLGQPVDVHNLEIELRHAFQNLGRRRRAGGHRVNRVIEALLLLGRREREHVEHDRRAAEMRYAVAIDQLEKQLRHEGADADHGGRERGHGPGVSPAVAVKHRHGVEVARVRRQRPRDHRAHGHQVGAAMVVDHALGPAGCARGVIQRQRLPFVLGRTPAEGVVTAVDQILVVTELEVVRQFRFFGRVRIVDNDDFGPAAAD